MEILTFIENSNQDWVAVDFMDVQLYRNYIVWQQHLQLEHMVCLMN